MKEEDQRLENEINHGKFIAKHGEEIWNWSSPAGKVRWQRRVDIFKDYIGNKNKKILEIGCGTGLFTSEIACTSNQIVAIDISKDLLDIARRKVNKKNVVFQIENAYKSSFKDKSFDFIVGSSVLHHLDEDLALQEFFRVLKDGGKIIFTEPNILNPQIALQKNIAFIKKAVGDSPDEKAFLKWSLEKKLKKYGFKDIEIINFDFLHPAIPKFMLSIMRKITYIIEKIPVIKLISGSLIIKASK